VSNYIATQSGGHFTAKEFRTWNATVLMALVLASAGPSATPAGRKRVIAASIREVARALGDTPAVARSAYIDPRLVTHYEAEGELAGIPAQPAELPAAAGTEAVIAAFLTSCGDGVVPAGKLSEMTGEHGD
jgi:DNA topoisomerase IB